MMSQTKSYRTNLLALNSKLPGGASEAKQSEPTIRVQNKVQQYEPNMIFKTSQSVNKSQPKFHNRSTTIDDDGEDVLLYNLDNVALHHYPGHSGAGRNSQVKPSTNTASLYAEMRKQSEEPPHKHKSIMNFNPHLISDVVEVVKSPRVKDKLHKSMVAKHKTDLLKNPDNSKLKGKKTALYNLDVQPDGSGADLPKTPVRNQRFQRMQPPLPDTIQEAVKQGVENLPDIFSKKRYKNKKMLTSIFEKEGSPLISPNSQNVQQSVFTISKPPKDILNTLSHDLIAGNQRLKQNHPQYQIRNRSEELEKLLKPCHNFKKLRFDEEDRFATSNSIHFKDLGKKQREENLHLEKDDIRFTRRIMETHNNQSIGVAANLTNSLGCRKDAIQRLKKYVGADKPMSYRRDLSPLTGRGTQLEVDKKAVLQNPKKEDAAANTQYEWAPCRFNEQGWKYQEKSTVNKFLNHPFKANSIGGFGPNLSFEQLKQNLLPQSSSNKANQDKIKELKSIIDRENTKYKRGNHYQSEGPRKSSRSRGAQQAKAVFDGQKYLLTGGSIPNFYLEEFMRKKASGAKDKKKEYSPKLRLY